MGKRKVSLQPELLLVWGLLLFLNPGQVFAPFFLAAALHELAHGAAIYLCGGKVLSVRLTVSGAVMETSPLSYGKETLCALAGPAASFSLLLVGKYAPWLAFWGMLQGCYNLLPIYPMDGGRALRGILLRHLSMEQTDRILRCCKIVTFAALLMASLYGAWVWQIGYAPLLLVCLLLFRMYEKETPGQSG